MRKDRLSAIDKMLQRAEFQRSARVVQTRTFDIIHVLQEHSRPLTLVEITHALKRWPDSHLDIADLVTGLVLSGYLDADEAARETRYSLHQGCEPRLPLPYYGFRYRPDDDCSN